MSDTETEKKIDALDKQNRLLLSITVILVATVILLTLYVYFSKDPELYYSLRNPIFFLAILGLVFDVMAYRTNKNLDTISNAYCHGHEKQ